MCIVVILEICNVCSLSTCTKSRIKSDCRNNTNRNFKSYEQHLQLWYFVIRVYNFQVNCEFYNRNKTEFMRTLQRSGLKSIARFHLIIKMGGSSKFTIGIQIAHKSTLNKYAYNNTLSQNATLDERA